MEVGLRVPLEADIQQEGVVVLPGRLLLDVVRALPSPRVSLELRAAQQDVELRSGARPLMTRVRWSKRGYVRSLPED